MQLYKFFLSGLFSLIGNSIYIYSRTQGFSTSPIRQKKWIPDHKLGG